MNIEVNDFNGPLDLLLHLIKTSKMDIYDIDIKVITKEYIDYINNNNNSFSIWVREFLNNFTSDNEPAPSPVAPSDDKNVLKSSFNISFNVSSKSSAPSANWSIRNKPLLPCEAL